MHYLCQYRKFCSYCKPYGHQESTCLKLITKELEDPNLCRDYNRFSVAKCEVNGICTGSRIHHCSIRHKEHCKAFCHVFENSHHTEIPSSHANCESNLLKLICVTEEIVKTLDKMQSEKETLESKTSDEHRDHLPCDSTPTEKNMQLIMVTQIAIKAKHSQNCSTKYLPF